MAATWGWEAARLLRLLAREAAVLWLCWLCRLWRLDWEAMEAAECVGEFGSESATAWLLRPSAWLPRSGAWPLARGGPPLGTSGWLAFAGGAWGGWGAAACWLGAGDTAGSPWALRSSATAAMTALAWPRPLSSSCAACASEPI